MPRHLAIFLLAVSLVAPLASPSPARAAQDDPGLDALFADMQAMDDAAEDGRRVAAAKPGSLDGLDLARDVCLPTFVPDHIGLTIR